MLKIRKIYGFTLLEVMVTVIILGVAVLLAVPIFFNIVEANYAEEGKHKLQALLGAQKRYAIEHKDLYTSNISNIDVDILVSATFFAPYVNDNITASFIAGIGRKGSNPYTLFIKDDGTFVCASSNNNGMCTKIGMQECNEAFCGAVKQYP